MYDSDFWYICPVWFIPAGFLWAALEILWDKFGLLDKLCNRFPCHGKNRVRKWIHGVTGVISYIITFPIAIVILKLIDYKD